MEKLVDIVLFLNQEINNIFGSPGIFKSNKATVILLYVWKAAKTIVFIMSKL